VTTVTLVTALGIPEGAQPHPGMASGGIAPLHGHSSNKYALSQNNYCLHVGPLLTSEQQFILKYKQNKKKH